MERLVPSENFWLMLRCVFGYQMANPACRRGMGARAVPADRATPMSTAGDAFCVIPFCANFRGLHAGLRALSIGDFYCFIGGWGGSRLPVRCLLGCRQGLGKLPPLQSFPHPNRWPALSIVSWRRSHPVLSRVSSSLRTTAASQAAGSSRPPDEDTDFGVAAACRLAACALASLLNPSRYSHCRRSPYSVS